MESAKSRVTIHMAASLDGFIARKDGSVDWLETSDIFEGGDTMGQESVEEFLRTIDCYVMGSRTYQTALDFEAKGLGWSYGDTPTFVLTNRKLRKTRNTVEFCSGDLDRLVDEMVTRGVRYEDAHREFEKKFIALVLARSDGNLCRAADLLGMHRNTLSRKMTEYQIRKAAKAVR